MGCLGVGGGGGMDGWMDGWKDEALSSAVNYLFTIEHDRRKIVCAE
jgi:hypothetical protein